MRKRILIVEDVELNADLLVQLLEDEYEVFVAMDGQQGIAMTHKEQPDLILMDLSLPMINGWDATHYIKSHKQLCHIPIIALTAHAMKGDAEQALESGCDDYLAKPLDDQLLFDKLTHFLRG